MSTVSSASGRHPRELDDRAWLERRYLRDGDMALALELHVSRGTVIRARERLGIPSQPMGRRRGVAAPVLRVASPAGEQIAARIGEQSRRNGPAPSKRLIAERFAALVSADSTGTPDDFRVALIELAAGCGLVHDHLQRLDAV